MKRGVVLVGVALTMVVGLSPTRAGEPPPVEGPAPVWGPIERLSTNFLQQAAVMSPDGTAMVIRAGRRITSREASPDQPWKPAETVPHSVGHLRLIGAGADRTGTVTAVWQKESHSGRKSWIYAADRPAGESWSAPTRVARTPGIENLWTAPRAAFGAEGATVVTWGGFRHSRAVYRRNTGTWTNPVTIASGRAPIPADAAISARGHATAAFQDPRGLHVVQRRAGGWSDPVRLPLRAKSFTHWDLDAGRSREVVVVWQTGDGPVRSGRFTDRSWTRHRVAEPTGRVNELLVDAARDGSARFVWTVGRVWRPGEVQGAYQDETGAIGDLVVIAPRGGGCAASTLTSSPSGRGLLAGTATSRSGETGEVFAAHWDDAESTWAAPDDLSVGIVPGPCSSVAAAIGDDGSAVVAWFEVRPNWRAKGTFVRRAYAPG